jgi:Dehydratase family
MRNSGSWVFIFQILYILSGDAFRCSRGNRADRRAQRIDPRRLRPPNVELHKLTPALGVLLDRGQRVALLTDGRMSGASGKVPAAIHCTPEAAVGGPLARLRDGDLIALDCDAGRLEVLNVELDQRLPAPPPPGEPGLGRELFAPLRELIGPADRGASVCGGALAEDAVVAV